MSITDLGAIRRQREAATRREPPVIEREDDPFNPYRSGFRISHESAAAVQAAITAIMAELEFCGGIANFTHPIRDGAVYFAVGETIVFP